MTIVSDKLDFIVPSLLYFFRGVLLHNIIIRMEIF